MTRKTECKIGDHIAVRYGIKNKLKCVIYDIHELPDGNCSYYVKVENHIRESHCPTMEIDWASVDVNTGHVSIVSYR